MLTQSFPLHYMRYTSFPVQKQTVYILCSHPPFLKYLNVVISAVASSQFSLVFLIFLRTEPDLKDGLINFTYC